MEEQLELFDNIEDIQLLHIYSDKIIDDLFSNRVLNVLEGLSIFKPIYIKCLYDRQYHYLFNKIKSILTSDSMENGNYHFYHSKIHFILMSNDK